MEKHQTYLERDINRLNELFDNQIDFTRKRNVNTLYLFVDNSSKRQLILSDVFSEIREMKIGVTSSILGGCFMLVHGTELVIYSNTELKKKLLTRR